MVFSKACHVNTAAGIREAKSALLVFLVKYMICVLDTGLRMWHAPVLSMIFMYMKHAAKLFGRCPMWKHWGAIRHRLSGSGAARGRRKLHTSDTNNCGIESSSNHLCLNTLYPKTKPLFSVPPAAAFIHEYLNHVTLDTNIMCVFK